MTSNCENGRLLLMDTLDDPQELLRRLDGESADALESQTVEFKSWNQGSATLRSQLREVRETVVAFANSSGGVLILGVGDHEQTRAAAIHGVGDLDRDELVRSVYTGTDPPILVDAAEFQEPEGRVVAVRVPRGVPPHTTTDGVGKIRVGKENRPLTGPRLTQLVSAQGLRDPTAETLPDARLGDLDPREIDRLREAIRANRHRPELAALDDQSLLEALGLTAEEEVTLAAVLLVGTRSALARFAARHEVILLRRRDSISYDLREDMRRPLLALLEQTQQLLNANARLTTVQPPGFQQLEIPDINWSVVREALLNALAHRDYFLNQSIHLDLYPDRIELASPGGFIGGVTPQNVLRHQPVRRNPLLAEALQQVGLINRAGIGVDQIFEQQLVDGKDMPSYDADESHVRMQLPITVDPDFAQFVFDARRAGAQLDLDDLIVLRGVAMRGALDRWSAAELLQLNEQRAAQRLVLLREGGFLLPEGRGRATVYRFADPYTHLARMGGADDLASAADESVRRMILTMLREHRYLANADLRQLTGLSRGQVYQLMRQLREEGLVETHGWGRGARYVLADHPPR